MASRRIRVVVQSLEGFVERLIRKLVLDIVAAELGPEAIGARQLGSEHRKPSQGHRRQP